MTISGSYPTDSVGQKEYMDIVNQTFKNMEARTSLVTVHGNAEPSASVLRAQWDSQIPYAPPSLGSAINWFNPNTGKVQQVYYPQDSGGGVLLPYKSKPSNSAWEYITDVVIGTAGALDTGASYSIPATYRHLLILYSARAAFAGVGTETLGIRLNNTATATHQWQYAYIISSTTPNISGGQTAQTFGYAGAVVQDNFTNLSQATVGHILIPNYSVSVAGFGSRAYNGNIAGVFSNSRPYTKDVIRFHGFIPVTAAVTRVQLLAATNTNLQRGSKMVLYGLK